VAISTGTNNVFPGMVEGTLAGLAAGLVATGRVGNEQRSEERDLALIDVVTCRRAGLPLAVGARALWEPAHLAEIVLSRVEPAAIGMASLGGLLFPEACGGCSGVHVVVGPADAPRQVLAPLAPGLLRRVPVERATLLGHGETVTLGSEPCTVALDGEREFEILPPGAALRVTLNPCGPRLVDIAAALRAGAEIGYFVADESRMVSPVRP
jgi:hypothetical protein